MAANDKIYYVKRGDTASPFEDHLAIDGVSLDIATVKGVMRRKDRSLVFERAGEVLQWGAAQRKSEPNVRLVIEPGDLEDLGVHQFEWRCELPSGRIVTMPRGGYYLVKVEDTLSEVQALSSSSSASQSSSSA